MTERSRAILSYAALILLVSFVELVLAFYNPRWKNPDELSHAQHVLFLRRERRLPDPYLESPKILQDKHPPLTYALGAAVVGATENWFDAARGEQSWRLPGPYEVALYPHRWSEELRLFEGQLYLLRLLMALFSVGAAVFLLRSARLVLPDHPSLAFGLTGALALIPQVALSGASLTPDTPQTFFCAAAWFYLLRLRLRDDDAPWPSLLLAGLYLGLAMLCKSSSTFLLPVSVILGFPSIKRAAAPVAVALLVSGWWYARNWLLYGDPFQMRATLEAFASAMRFSPMGGPEWETVVQGLADSFFGFWHQEIRIAAPLMLAFHFVTGAALLGLLLLAAKRRREELPIPLARALPAALAGFTTMLALVVLGNIVIPSPQGRYFYPTLGPILVLLAAGLFSVLRIGKDSLGWLALPPLIAALTLWSFFQIIVARDSVVRSHARGEGEVLFYEDGGNPEHHPHRVRGFDLPDQNQLGRRTPWRSLDVDLEAVEYRFDLAGTKADDLQVRVLYHNPDPSLPALADRDGRLWFSAQRLWAGKALLHDRIDVTPTPRELVYPIPDGAVEGGELKLRFEKVSGSAATVSEIWIERRWIAAQGFFRDPGGRWSARLQNRLPRSLSALLFFKALGKEGKLIASGCLRTDAPAASGGNVATWDVPLDLPPAEAPVTIEAAVLLAEQSPFAVFEAEALPEFSGRCLGDPTASGGYRLTGSNEGGRLLQLALPAAASGPGFVRILCRPSELVLDETLRIHRGSAKGSDSPLRIEITSGRGKSESLTLGTRGFASYDAAVFELEGNAKLTFSVDPGTRLVDLDRIDLFAAPGILRSWVLGEGR